MKQSLPCLMFLFFTLVVFSVFTAFPMPAVFAEEAVQEASAQTEEESKAEPAKAYILLTFSGGSYWLPLPDSEDYTLPVRQVRDDGTEEVNMIHVTPDGFYMESSTCENQDCVNQGMVTLENRNERILYNAVLCLPNQVSLALYTPEEILEMYASYAEENGSEDETETQNAQ